MATIHTLVRVLYVPMDTIIEYKDSMIDSKGKIIAERTTKYMMLRPVHPRRESMYPPKQDKMIFEMTVSVATMTEFPIARRIAVCLNSVVKAASDQVCGKIVAPWPKTDSPGALNAARRGSRSGPTIRIATTTSVM